MKEDGGQPLKMKEGVYELDMCKGCYCITHTFVDGYCPKYSYNKNGKE